MYDAVLVPTDGSSEAEYAARYAVSLAETTGATVHVLSVVDESLYPRASVLSDDLVQESLEAAREAAGEAVDRVAEMVEQGTNVVTEVRQGIPAESIRAYAADHGVDLVVMGTHGRTGLQRYFIGSVAEEVVRTADVPVLTVRRDTEEPAATDISRVLVPTDGSDESMAAVDHAVDVAATYDATLHALYVVDQRALASYYDAGPMIGDLIDNLTSVGENATEAVRERARERDVTVETTVLQGIPPAAIDEYAGEHDIDLVVMGTHGRTGVERYLLGSVTERVVRTSAVPVLTVRPAESEVEE
jgi:nucleotide-binding universal stress UspA family protein